MTSAGVRSQPPVAQSLSWRVRAEDLPFLGIGTRTFAPHWEQRTIFPRAPADTASTRWHGMLGHKMRMMESDGTFHSPGRCLASVWYRHTRVWA